VSGEQSKQVVRDYVAQVLNRGDMPASARLIGDEALLQRVAAFRVAFPDLHVVIRELVGEGDLVAGHFLGTGTHVGVFAGCPPTGRQWTAACTAIFRVRDGRIVDHHVTWDLLTLLEQLDCVRRMPTVSA